MGALVDVLKAKAEIAAATLKLKQAELAVLLGVGDAPEPEEPEPGAGPMRWLGKQDRYGETGTADRKQKYHERRQQITADHAAFMAGEGGGDPGSTPLMYSNRGGNNPRWFDPDDM